MKNILLTGSGIVFLLLAAIGLFIPIWPTTPFVLLAAGCLSTAPRLQQKVLKIPFFKEHIENYQTRQGLSKKTFITSLVFLWGMLILSMILKKQLWFTLLLSAVGIGVTIHIVWISKRRK